MRVTGKRLLAWPAQPARFGSSRGRRPGRIGSLVAGVAGVALLVAGCSGGASSAGGSYGAGTPMSSGSPGAAVVDVHASKLGDSLVDGRGRTLYLFEADSAGKSTCAGACAAAWPPYLTTGAPSGGKGVAAQDLATSHRDDPAGGTQVTYHGHPLYYYAGDTKPGDMAGQGLDQFGAHWYVVGPNGNKIDND